MSQPTPLEQKVEELVHTNDINPTNAEIREDFRSHAMEDHKFQDETRTNHEETKDTLAVILAEVRELKAEIVEVKANMAPILELYKGLTFGSKAVKWTSGIVLAITVIVGSGIAIVKYLKG